MGSGYKTEKDLKYALRVDEIKYYQKFPGLTDPPKWYYAREVPEFWYVSDTPACHSFLNATLGFCQCGHILSEGSFFDSYIIPPLVCKHATQYQRSSGQTRSCNYYLVY